MVAFTPVGRLIDCLIFIETLTWVPTTSMAVTVPAGRPSTRTFDSLYRLIAFGK